MTSSLPTSERTFDFDADPAPSRKVTPSQVDAQLDVLHTWNNAAKAALDNILRSDDTLKDNSLLLRMMHPEVVAFMAQRGDWQAKSPVMCATIEDRALTGLGTIDGYVLQIGNRVLVKDQDDATENGIWVAAAGAWARATDADGAGELDNAFVRVTYGTVNASTSWVVAGESLTPGTDEIPWSAYAWQGSTPGSSGGGGSLGRSVQAAPFLAAGDGVTDDTLAIQACIDAVEASGGGVVYFPTGTHLITDYLEVPANVRLLGESAATAKILAGAAVCGINLNGDHGTLECLQFCSTDANRFQVKSVNVNHPTVRFCHFNRAHVIIGNDTNTEVVGGRVEDCLFTGSYLPWVASVNVIQVRGVKHTHVCRNKLIGVVSPYRMLKLQASGFYATGAVGDQYAEGLVCTDNLIIGTMTSGKQVVDCFNGVGRATIARNIMVIVGTGSGFACFIEQKTGDTPSNLYSAKMSELQVVDNVLIGNPISRGIFVTGAYSLPWEGGEQSVTVSRNELRVDDTAGGDDLIRIGGMHRVACNENQITVSNAPALVYSALSLPNNRTVQAHNNQISHGQIFVWGGSTTTGGDAFTGATEEISIVGNVLEQFLSDKGGIEINDVVGTPSLVCSGNTINSTLGTSTQALVYLRDTTLSFVTCYGNAGECGASARNRLLQSGTTTVTLLHEYMNEWNTKTILEFDYSNNRETVGNNTNKIDRYLEVATGQTYNDYFRFNEIIRCQIAVSATAWLMYAYDAAGVLIDNLLNINLNSGQRFTINRPVGVKGNLRPEDDNTHDFGQGALRWKTLYTQGGFHSGIAPHTVSFNVGTDEHVVLVDCTAGNVVVTLAANASSRNGKHTWIKRIDNSGNTVTVQRPGSDQIRNGFTLTNSFTLAAGVATLIAYDQANAIHERIY